MWLHTVTGYSNLFTLAAASYCMNKELFILLC